MSYKLAVGYPWSSPFISTAFAERSLNMQKPDGYDVRWFKGGGWCPARRHIHICEQALEWGADLICIIGSDQIHPEDMFPRLVKRFEEGYEVVTAFVPARGYVSWQDMKPFQPMAWRWKTDNSVKIRTYRGMDLDADMIEVVKQESGGMQKINFIGSGVLMFHRDHLLALQKPWFRETIMQENYQRLANQDALFVYRLQLEAHAEVWVDTTIKVLHEHLFKIDETYQDRFSDWERGNGDPTICRYRESGKQKGGGNDTVKKVSTHSG